MARTVGLRGIRLALWGLVLAAGLGVSGLFLSGPRPGPQPGDTLGQGGYRLQTTEGRPFTPASLTGQPSLVFFGFTHCPDICPGTLGAIMGWKEDLGPPGAALRVWFVTVDPERDTADVLRDYLSWLPGAAGVTGSLEETAAALRAFGITARKVALEGGYSMDHSAHVLLFDRHGRYSQSFGHMEPAAGVVARLRRFLEAGG